MLGERHPHPQQAEDHQDPLQAPRPLEAAASSPGKATTVTRTPGTGKRLPGKAPAGLLVMEQSPDTVAWLSYSPPEPVNCEGLGELGSPSGNRQSLSEQAPPREVALAQGHPPGCEASGHSPGPGDWERPSPVRHVHQRPHF